MDNVRSIEATIQEQMELLRAARLQRRHESKIRRALRDSDTLLAAIEEYRVQGTTVLPHSMWDGVAHFLWHTDRRFLAQLGRSRTINNVIEVLFELQAVLMSQALLEHQIIEIPDSTALPFFGPLRNKYSFATQS